MNHVPVLAWSGARWGLASEPSDAVDELTLVTLNVWFDEHERARRTRWSSSRMHRSTRRTSSS